MVRVVLHGHARRYAPHAQRVLAVDGGGKSARDVLGGLGVPLDDTAAIVVQGQPEELGRVVRDGETLEIMPAISGGRAGRFPPEMADVLLSPERRAHIDPVRALGEFGLHERAVFADLGCGPGFFTIPAAKVVGPRGRVHAADVQPEMLERVREAARASRLANVDTHLVREEPRRDGWRYDFGIEGVSIDLALVAFVLHEVEEPAAFLRDAAALLRPSGRIALLQWQARDTYAGPAVQARMTPEVTLQAIARAGLRAQPAPPLDPDHYAYFVRP